MCTYSYISDDLQKQSEQPKIVPNEYIPVEDWPSKIEKIGEYLQEVKTFMGFNFKQCVILVELLEKAHEFDIETDQRECADPEKIKFLEDLMEYVAAIDEDSVSSVEKLKLVVRIEDVLKEVRGDSNDD